MRREGQGGGEVPRVEPHDRDIPVVQLVNHQVRRGVVQIGDDQNRTRGSHWSVSLPVSESPPPACPSDGLPVFVDGFVPLLVPWPGIIIGLPSVPK